jgi:hypothetical protein
MKLVKIPLRYLPDNLTKKDRRKQLAMLNKSKKQYKQDKYFTRAKLSSYKNKPSNHVKTAKKMYNVEKIVPNKELAEKTGCSVDALEKIVKKGEGAFFSSGSRPNQTPQSWGIARLASSITSGKSAAVDYNILENGCNHNKKAFLLAKRARRKYNHGQSKTRKVTIKNNS